uniref:Uncharacterized protein n=1 Tax=Aureoumbra lagunensis TaxID=44058 RepID=A0A7S3K7J8_9STRA|mmetsp:Transcript_13263/g.17707  ORF Transcript_13263/g.17707 Transcript_13263/m.17707 type:complete len:187 (+) Transcript_13263:72-632(+)
MEAPNYWIALLFFVLIFLVAYFGIESKFSYVEKIVIRRNASEVYDAIRLQSKMMQWIRSIPVKRRGQRGIDGEIESSLLSFDRLVYTMKQIVKNKFIEFHINDTFGQHQIIRYELEEETTSATTTVKLHFIYTIDRPFHIVVVSAGFPEYFCSLQRQDLVSLKQYLEDDISTLPSIQQTMDDKKIK